jgi:hypothetical protein
VNDGDDWGSVLGVHGGAKPHRRVRAPVVAECG